MTLFENEHLITHSADSSVQLTTHRICYEYREWGRSYNQNIMLEHITSSETYSSSLNILLLIALGTLVGAAYAFIDGKNEELLIVMLFLSLAFIILFLFLRISYVVFGSPSTKMKIRMKMKREDVLEFVNQVEIAKHQRMETLNK